MDVGTIAALVAAVFSALAFLDAQIVRWKKRRNRPIPRLSVHQDSVSKNGNGEIVGHLVTFTNTGNIPIRFVDNVQVINAGQRLQLPDIGQPDILLPGATFQLAFSSPDPGTTYVRYIILDVDGDTNRGYFFGWRSVYRYGAMDAERLKQHREQPRNVPRWVTGQQIPQFVGPGGISGFYLSSRKSEAVQMEWLKASSNPAEIGPKKSASRPRRLLIKIWNTYAWATRQSHRMIPADA